ncbi:hypothetical protein CLU79DRAFT_766996 [Phycomyces nitens]|nr:hypothetical protein CLU79DRAFT_766996 [Phycomyces nitens]
MYICISRECHLCLESKSSIFFLGTVFSNISVMLVGWLFGCYCWLLWLVVPAIYIYIYIYIKSPL